MGEFSKSLQIQGSLKVSLVLLRTLDWLFWGYFVSQGQLTSARHLSFTRLFELFKIKKYIYQWVISALEILQIAAWRLRVDLSLGLFDCEITMT